MRRKIFSLFLVGTMLLTSTSLTALAKEGHRCIVLIVIQLKGVHVFRPNRKTHPEFADALIDARNAGVEIIAMDCEVVPGKVNISLPVPVELALC